MDFFKPGSTLKREDPKAHSYENERARSGYKKQLEIFKIRFEAELAKHPRLDFDAKQEVRIKAKRLRETCLSAYRESLQGLATTNHRRNYKDLFLGSREIAYQMHDTNILDYELRLAHEIDTIIDNLKLMTEDKSNRDTLDWMAKLAKQKFSYEMFEVDEHPQETEIELEMGAGEGEEATEHAFDLDDDLAGPIYLSHRQKSKSPYSDRGETFGDYQNGFDRHREGSFVSESEDNYCPPTFNREFNYARSARVLDECDHDPEDHEKPDAREGSILSTRSYLSKPVSLWSGKSTTRDRVTLSPSPAPTRESLLDVAYSDYVHRDRGHRHDREDRPFLGQEPSNRRGKAPRPPVDVDDEDDVEEFLARSRALLRKSARPTNLSFLEDSEDEEQD